MSRLRILLSLCGVALALWGLIVLLSWWMYVELQAAFS